MHMCSLHTTCSHCNLLMNIVSTALEYCQQWPILWVCVLTVISFLSSVWWHWWLPSWQCLALLTYRAILKLWLSARGTCCQLGVTIFVDADSTVNMFVQNVDATIRGTFSFQSQQGPTHFLVAFVYLYVCGAVWNIYIGHSVKFIFNYTKQKALKIWVHMYVCFRHDW